LPTQMSQAQRAAIALFACFVLWCGWQSKLSSQQPLPPTQTQSANNRSEEKKHSQDNEGLWDWLTHDAAGFFAAWLVIIGGSQLALFYVQLKIIRESLTDAKIAADAAKESADATKASVDLSRQTAERQLRAYVYIDGGSFDYSGAYDSFRGTLCLKNYGQTPAYDQEVHASVRVFPVDAPVFNFTKSGRPSAKSTIGPGGESNIRRTVRSSGNEFDEVIDRKKAVFMWGFVTYRDAFDQTQTLEFRCVSARTRESNNVWVMEPYPDHGGD
jgi:hypothetical protein